MELVFEICKKYPQKYPKNRYGDENK